MQPPDLPETTSPARVVLEVDRSAEPIEGRLWTPEGDPLVFAGWLGLFAALETALGGGAHTPASNEEVGR